MDPHHIRRTDQQPNRGLSSYWLATNWWCLLHESVDRPGAAESSFRERHELGYSREGYRYPDLHVVSWDTRTRLAWKNDRLLWSRLEFLEREGSQRIDKEEFRRSCTKLVESVVARLSFAGITDTLLQEEWQAIQDADADEQRFCQTAAALGWDPYSIDQEIQAGVFRIEKVLKGAVFEEALPILDTGNLQVELAAIERVLKVGKAKTIPLDRSGTMSFGKSAKSCMTGLGRPVTLLQGKSGRAWGWTALRCPRGETWAKPSGSLALRRVV